MLKLKKYLALSLTMLIMNTSWAELQDDYYDAYINKFCSLCPGTPLDQVPTVTCNKDGIMTKFIIDRVKNCQLISKETRECAEAMTKTTIIWECDTHLSSRNKDLEIGKTEIEYTEEHYPQRWLEDHPMAADVMVTTKFTCSRYNIGLSYNGDNCYKKSKVNGPENVGLVTQTIDEDTGDCEKVELQK